MSTRLLTQTLDHLDPEQCTVALEEGNIIFFPEYYFTKIDPSLMSEHILDKRHKNVGYDYNKKKLGCYNQDVSGLDEQLEYLLRGYADFSYELIARCAPCYVPFLQWGRTSFRPAQIKGRISSKRKDDTRLHVDSFSASPVNGLRILRVFCNINPRQEPRVWNVGDSFQEVLKQFAPRIPTYNKWVAKLLQTIKVTKTLRSPYDHYMLYLHDLMKLDDQYQAQVAKTQIDFPAQSTWIVFTDQVSHAALSGQYLLEQTFYLPVDAMLHPDLSPWAQWSELRQL